MANINVSLNATQNIKATKSTQQGEKATVKRGTDLRTGK